MNCNCFNNHVPDCPERKQPTEYEVMTAEPESLNVGKLNKIVRILREKLYQANLDRRVPY